MFKRIVDVIFRVHLSVKQICELNVQICKFPFHSTTEHPQHIIIFLQN